MGGFLDNAINLIPLKQNGNATATRGTSEQPATTKDYHNATTKGLGGVPYFKSNGLPSKAANASLHGGKEGGGSTTAAATYNGSGLSFSFQRRSDVIGMISHPPAAAPKTTATSAFLSAAGDATVQRPLQGMRNSASSPSLEAHIGSSHAGSRRVNSLQARPEDYENYAPHLPDEGLPEISFDDTTVDPRFFAEDETSLEQSITQKDSSLPPERQLHHAQNPDTLSKKRSRQLLPSGDNQRPLKKVNLGIRSNGRQDSNIESAQKLKDSFPQSHRPSQPASRAFPSTSAGRPISARSPKSNDANLTSPNRPLARSSAKKFIYIDDNAMRFPELTAPSINPGYRAEEERQHGAARSPPRNTVHRPQSDLGSDSSDADDEAVKIPSNNRSPASGRAVQGSNRVRLQRPTALHDPFESQGAELPELAHGNDDEGSHSSPIVEWTKEDQCALEARALAKRQEKESEKGRERAEMDYDELLPDEDIEEDALESLEEAQTDQAHLNDGLQLPTSEADHPRDDQAGHVAQGGVDLDQEEGDEQMVGEEVVFEERVPQEVPEKRPDCQCGRCMLPLKAQRDDYDLQTFDEWCDEGKLYIQQLPELLTKMLDVMNARVQAVNTLANKPKFHKESIIAKQAENETQRNKIKAWKNGLPFGAQFAAPPALAASDRGGSVSDTPPRSHGCPAS